MLQNVRLCACPKSQKRYVRQVVMQSVKVDEGRYGASQCCRMGSDRCERHQINVSVSSDIDVLVRNCCCFNSRWRRITEALTLKLRTMEDIFSMDVITWISGPEYKVDMYNASVTLDRTMGEDCRNLDIHGLEMVGGSKEAPTKNRSRHKDVSKGIMACCLYTTTSARCRLQRYKLWLGGDIPSTFIILGARRGMSYTHRVCNLCLLEVDMQVTIWHPCYAV